jgi:tripartite-type tricarboxylate transporter receptor subunit TctC
MAGRTPLSCSRFARASLVLLSLAVCGGVRADDYPAHAVRVIVPYAAGGGTDAMARFIARGLEARLGQAFIVENRPGSGTATGGAYVAKSAPDGYTLLMATSSTLAINPNMHKNLPYDPAVDFSPIGMVAAVPFVLIVHPSLTVTSVDGLIRLAREKPGALSYASGGVGAPHHVYMELLKSITGVDIKHIPYRGGGPALTDVTAGHVPIMFADVAQALELVREGRVIALGVTTARRVDTMPQVPTLQEAGIADYEANSWQCVVAPAHVPGPIVTRLNKALMDILAMPETRHHFTALGVQPVTATPAETGAYIRSEIARWAKVVRSIGGIEN